MKRHLPLLLAPLLTLTASVRGDEIILKGSVRLSPGMRVVRLADIATLQGPHAERLGEVEITPVLDSGAVMEVPIQLVRRVLDEAGVHWGKIQLRGRRVIVRPVATPTINPPLAMGPASIGRAGSPIGEQPVESASIITAAHLITRDTVRGEVARAIVDGLMIEPAALRLVFDDQDLELLDTPLTTAQYELHPRGSLDSDRIGFTIRKWQDTRIIETYSINIRPMFEREVLIIRRDAHRGERLAESDLTAERRWMARSHADRVVDLAELAARPLARRLRLGSVLHRDDLQAQEVINRGDRVIVRCLVGGLVVTLEAEARGSAERGQRIELRKRGERDTFYATAVGPGEAIVDLRRTTP